MKILFLDIDGVMLGNNTIVSNVRRGRDQKRFGYSATSTLEYIVEMLNGDLKIVISSSWRLFREVSFLRTELERCCFPVKALNSIIGVTPYFPNLGRGEEILHWLNNAKLNGMEITNWVVLDDEDFDMGGVLNHLVKTNPDRGLNFNYTSQIFEVLNYQPSDQIEEENWIEENVDEEEVLNEDGDEEWG